jgi:lincosamide nucleotidyltransferase B/F
MYGSFAGGAADEHSDVEFWLFFDPKRRGEVEPRAWCAQIAQPLLHIRRCWTELAHRPGGAAPQPLFAEIDRRVSRRG